MIAVVFIVAMSFGIRRLKVDNSFNVWFVDDDPALISYNTFKEKFGNDEVIVTTITDTQSIFSPQRLKKLVQLTDSMKAIEGIARVISLTDTYVPLFDSTGLKVQQLRSIIPVDSFGSDLQKIITQLKSTKQFISPDCKTVALFSWLDTLENLDAHRGDILKHIDRLARKSVTIPDTNVNHGGFGVVFNALNQATINDGTRFILLSYTVIAIFLLFITRSFLWSLIAILSVTCANLTVFGLMGLFNRPVTMVSMALPPLIMVLGITNILHISEHIRYSGTSRKTDISRIISSLAIIVLPCIFNALTTAGGFFSLGSARMAVTRDYGIFAAIGVIAALMFSVSGTLLLLKNITKRERKLTSLHNTIKKTVTTTMVWAFRHRVIICILFLIIVLVSFLTASSLIVDTYSINFLPQNHQVVEDSRLIEKRIGNYLPLEFLITPNEKIDWEDPMLIRQLSKAQKACEELSNIDATLSIADYQNVFLQLKALASFSEQSASSVAAFRDSLDQAGIMNSLIDKEGRTLRFTVWVSMASAKKLTAIADSVLSVTKPILGSSASIIASGYIPLYGQMVKNVLYDQIVSFSVALIVILLLIGLILRSVKMVLIALPCNAIPIAIIFGFMGYRGIRLDIATVTIAAAVIGIIVDDTIHILYNLKCNLQSGSSFSDSIQEVAKQTGVAVISTSITLASGFIVIAFSGIKSIAYTGLLTAIAVGAALIADLILLPAIAHFYYGKK